MKQIYLLFFSVLIAEQALALPNPAAVYCEKFGYEYKKVQTPEGEKGIVIIEPGVQFDAWDFFRGKVGREYSFGAFYGYDAECVRTNIGTYVAEYAVCVPRVAKGLKTGARIALTDLMAQKSLPLFDEMVERGKKAASGKFVPANREEDMLGIYDVMAQDKMIPVAFDWRTNNSHAYIGSIRDQGSCGSCYAFGAAASAEGTYNWAMGKYDADCINFSESFIIWCLGRLPQYTSHFFGCDGADYDYAELTALTTEGVCLEADFPYTGSDPGSCTHWSDPVTVFSSWHRITCGDVDAIKTAIMTYGVVDAAVYAGSSFQSYSSGIYTDANTSCYSATCYYTPVNHAIALVGWDDNPPEGGGGCWILRNSWGTSWGESGYMRIRYNAARVACEVCYFKYLVTDMKVLDTNGVVVASDAAASAAKGTDFGAWSAGASVTNTFSITNSGIGALEITGVTTSGAGAVYFTVNGMPGTVTAAGVSNFAVVFSAGAVGVHTAVIAIVNNITNTPYRVNFRGTSGSEIGLSTTALAFAGTYGGAIPAANTFTIINLGRVGFNFTNAVSYGSGASGWLNVLPVNGNVSGSGAQMITGSVNIAALNAGVYTATNAVTSTNAANSPQNVVVTLTVNKADQAIIFPNPGAQITTNMVGLSATAGSGLAVSFSVGSGPAQITGGTNLSFTVTGVVQVVASQSGNALWNAAASVTNIVIVHDVSFLAAPANLAASDGTYTDKVAVTWDAVVGASAYEVWRNGNNNMAAALKVGQIAGALNCDLVNDPVARHGVARRRTPCGATDGESQIIGDALFQDRVSYSDQSSEVQFGTLWYYWVRAVNTATTSEFSAVDSGFCRLSPDVKIISGQPMVGDYDGDGLADPAVYSLESGRLFVWLSSAGYVLVTPVVTFQVAVGDLPVAGDFDGDGLADPGVFEHATGSWYIWLSSAGYIRVGPVMFGLDANDIPVPADYDGDLKTDPAVYLPAVPSAQPMQAGQASSGGWYVWLSGAGYVNVGPFPFQQSLADIPVPGDYDGDGRADPAVYLPAVPSAQPMQAGQQASGSWYIWLSSAGYFPLGPITFSTTEDHIAVPADYDGDGICDPATYMPTLGKWRMWMSGSGYALNELELK